MLANNRVGNFRKFAVLCRPAKFFSAIVVGSLESRQYTSKQSTKVFSVKSHLFTNLQKYSKY